MLRHPSARPTRPIRRSAHPVVSDDDTGDLMLWEQPERAATDLADFVARLSTSALNSTPTSEARPQLARRARKIICGPRLPQLTTGLRTLGSDRCRVAVCPDEQPQSAISTKHSTRFERSVPGRYFSSQLSSSTRYKPRSVSVGVERSAIERK